jgi:hypothetical protein
MADELIDPDMAQALMEAVRRSGPGMGAMRQQDALAEASEGVGRAPLTPEYGNPKYLHFLGGYGAPFEDVRSALDRSRYGFTERPSAPFGYPEFGADVYGTVGEQIMSMMPPQEPPPAQVARAPQETPVNWRINVGPGTSLPPAPLPAVEPGIRTELRDYREPTTAFQPPRPLPDPERAARVEQLIRDMEEQAAVEARLRALRR